MRKNVSLVVVFATLGLIALGLSHGNSAYPVQAAQGEKYDLGKAKFYGVATCKTCHFPKYNNQPKPELITFNEHPIWVVQDRHALAYAVLEGPRGMQMADLLKVDVTKAPMCLSCHATSFLPDQAGDKFSRHDGVSCDGCHGPAEKWFVPHAFEQKEWRSKSPGDKYLMGLFNVRDPVNRAELCVSCHVGSSAEGKVVTHSMYAAGHPPLPGFELATFSKNLPQHWMDLKDVPFFTIGDAGMKTKYDFDSAEFQHTRLVVAGTIVALRQAMNLLANRADSDVNIKPHPGSSWPPPWLTPHLRYDPKTRWPELEISEKFGQAFDKDADLKKTVKERYPEFVMGQADCYACHHELKTPSWRQQRANTGKPGRPQFQPWPVALAKIAVQPEHQKELFGLIDQLYRDFDAQPFGDSLAVSQSAQRIADFLDKKTKEPVKVDRQIAQGYLKTLTTLSKNEYPDYDSARQIAGALQAIYLDAWNANNPRQQEVKKIFKQMDDALNVTLHSSVRGKSSMERHALMKPHLNQSMEDLLKHSSQEEKKTSEQFLESLYRINNAELKEALDRIAGYDPVQFRKQLAELSELFANSLK